MNKLTNNLPEVKAKEGSMSQKTLKRPLINKNKEEFMEKRAWTARGEMTIVDKEAVKAFSENDKVASRIFVTGEVHHDYIGEAAYRTLINYNDVLCKKEMESEPLFVYTKENTIRMVRFDPNITWRCMHPELFARLVGEEYKRLGVNADPYMMDYFDFYESMIAEIKADKGDFILPIIPKGANLEYYYSAMYLSCLLLFGKPNYMDIPVAAYFSTQSGEAHLKYAEYRKLNKEQTEKVKKLREEYGRIQAITNYEMLFIVSIFAEEKSRKEKEVVCY
jgi:hypothetical protein